MKILVTGGSGFAGRHLLAELLTDDVDVTATWFGDLPPSVRNDSRLDGVTWLPLDLTSPDSVAEVISRTRPEAVYHLAGQASVSESIADPFLTWNINATGTMRLMSAIGEVGPTVRRILMVSSAEVYGAIDPVGQPIPPDTPIRPVTPYGTSKAAAELLALQMGTAAGIEVVVARSFNHIGPGQDDRFALPSMARQLMRIRRGTGERNVRVGNLDVVRDFLDVRDVARAYRTLMTAGTPGECYNVCSGRGRSLHSVVARMVELSETGAKLLLDQNRVRPVDIPMLVGDPGMLTELGWRDERPLDDTLRDLLAEASASQE